MKARLIIGFILSLGSIKGYSQVTELFPYGPTKAVCPNVLEGNYAVTGSSTTLPFPCAGPLASTTYNWTIVGGLIENPFTFALGSSMTLTGSYPFRVKWNFAGSSHVLSLTMTHTIGFPCNVTFSQTTKYWYPTFDTPSAIPPNPGPITFPPGTGNLCPGTSITVSTTIAANTDYQFLWSYRVDGGASNSLPNSNSSIGSGGKTSITFTTPSATNFTSGTHSIVFNAEPYFSRCIATGPSNTAGTSAALLVYPAAPTFTFSKTNGICTTPGAITVSGTSYSDQVMLRIVDVTGGLESVIKQQPLNFAAVGTFNWSYTNIPVKDGSNNFIPYHLQVVNYDASDAQLEQCYTEVDLATFPLTVNTVSVTPSVTDELCNDSSVGTGSISLAVGGTGVVGPYTYNWAHGATTQTISNLPGDVLYSVKVTDGNGCKSSPDTKDIRVEEPDAIQLSAASVTSNHRGFGVSCNNADSGIKNDGVIHIDATGGTGLLQYNLVGTTYSTPYQVAKDLTNLIADSYTVNVKDVNGCLAPAHPVLVVSAPSPITYLGPSKKDLLCNATPTGKLKVWNVSGGAGNFSYSNDGGVSVQSDSVFNNQLAGTYSVLITDGNNCSKTTTSKTINQPGAITLSLPINTTPQSCPTIEDGTLSAVASGGVGSRKYSVDNIAYVTEGSPTKFSGLTSGVYTLYVKDDNGCTITKPNIFIPINPTLSGALDQTTPISCFNQGDGVLKANVVGGTGAGTYTYTWNPLGNTSANQKINIVPGSYSVTVTDGKGCELSLTKAVTQPGLLSLSTTLTVYSGYAISCTGKNDGAIDLTVSGGTSPFTFDWSNTLAGVNPADVEDPGSLKAGKYAVTIKDAHNCTALLTDVTLNEPTPVVMGTPITSDVSCKNGADGTIKVTASGGASSYQYSLDSVVWQPATTFSSLKAGSYRVRLADNNKCVVSLPLKLIEPEKLILSKIKQENTVCGQANGSAQVSASGGVAAYNYTWYDGVPAQVGTGATLNNLLAGSYLAIVQDSKACRDTLVINISTSNGPVIVVGAKNDLTCSTSNDGSIAITVDKGQPPYAIDWLVNGTVSNEHANTIALLPKGTHTARVSDSGGCIVFETIKINSPLPITVTEELKSPTCSGYADGEIKLVAAGGNPGGYSYAWTNGLNGATLSLLKEGTYQVHITDTKNCFLDHTSILKDPAPIRINLGEDRTICAGQKVTLAPGLEGTYSWTGSTGFTSSDATVILSAPGTYKLVYHTKNNCVGEDEIKIVTATDLLKADFLMVAQAHAGDTVVLIDISWPLPENITWQFPAGTTTLSTDGPFAEVVFDTPGEYSVMLHTNLGECIDDYVKLIKIIESTGESGGRLATASHVIRAVHVSPNPMDKIVNVLVNLNVESEVYMALVTVEGNKVLYSHHEEGSDHYQWDITLPQISAGMYYLIVRSGKEVKIIRVVKI